MAYSIVVIHGSGGNDYVNHVVSRRHRWMGESEPKSVTVGALSWRSKAAVLVKLHPNISRVTGFTPDMYLILTCDISFQIQDVSWRGNQN